MREGAYIGEKTLMASLKEVVIVNIITPRSGLRRNPLEMREGVAAPIPGQDAVCQEE